MAFTFRSKLDPGLLKRDEQFAQHDIGRPLQFFCFKPGERLAIYVCDFCKFGLT